MKNRFAGITAAVMAAAMMMTFPVQAFAGTYGSAKNVGYVLSEQYWRIRKDLDHYFNCLSKKPE